jgi:2'-5' RNA ligase
MKPNAIRAFVAVSCPAEWRAEIKNLQRILASRPGFDSVRWTSEQQLHVTLRFFEHLDLVSISEVTSALHQSARGSGCFQLEAGELGCFPNPRKPRVLWLGFRGDLQPLMQLQRAIALNTNHSGIREEKEFRPHLTLGRVKTLNSSDLCAIGLQLEQQSPSKLPPWHVDTLELIQSELTSSGWRYTCLASASLRY